MNKPEERQGYLGDITTKPLSELKELLDRKEKLLANRSLLQKLPDKGKKAHEYVDKLKVLIDEKSKKNATKMEVCGNFAAFTTQHVTEHRTNVNKRDSHEGKTKQDMPGVQVVKTTTSKSTSASPDSLLDNFQSMSIGQKMERCHVDQQPTHSYEKIIHRDVDLLTNRNQKQEFLPNKTVKPRSSAGSENESAHSKASKLRTEESAVRPPQYKLQSSKLISLAESIQLTLEQEKRREELAIERTTMRLLGLNQDSTKMDIYDPPSTDMNYRLGDRQDHQGLDSDDDDVEDET